MTSRRTITRPWLSVTLALTVTMLAGCSGGSSAGDATGPSGDGRTSRPPTAVQGSGPAPSAATSSSPNTSEDAARAVEAAYRGYWAARVTAQAHPDQDPPADLDRYAIDKARTDVKSTMLRFRRQGIAFRGQPVLAPVVTVSRVPSTGVLGAALVVDCVDSSRWTPVFVDTGRSALAPGQAMRVVVESTARTYEGRWVVATSLAHRDRPC